MLRKEWIGGYFTVYGKCHMLIGRSIHHQIVKSNRHIQRLSVYRMEGGSFRIALSLSLRPSFSCLISFQQSFSPPQSVWANIRNGPSPVPRTSRIRQPCHYRLLSPPVRISCRRISPAPCASACRPLWSSIPTSSRYSSAQGWTAVSSDPRCTS